ncbi:MAG: hypothetical protein HWD58_12600 [Bacteroidota bacterium]|nr:MAG: hypothetical protein HWD58_12600 [Bacteroidota bacterium]
MKKSLILLLLAALTLPAQSQTVNDLLNQANNLLNGGSNNQNSNGKTQMGSGIRALPACWVATFPILKL